MARGPATTLEIVRDKERELVVLIDAARREAAELLAEAQDKAQRMMAEASAAASARADAFLTHELAAVDREAQAILAGAESEAGGARRAGALRLPAAVEFVVTCVAPEVPGEEEH